jgi:hypothetical protein
MFRLASRMTGGSSSAYSRALEPVPGRQSSDESAFQTCLTGPPGPTPYSPNTADPAWPHYDPYACAPGLAVATPVLNERPGTVRRRTQPLLPQASHERQTPRSADPAGPGWPLPRPVQLQYSRTRDAGAAVGAPPDTVAATSARDGQPDVLRGRARPLPPEPSHQRQMPHSASPAGVGWSSARPVHYPHTRDGRAAVRAPPDTAAAALVHDERPGILRAQHLRSGEPLRQPATTRGTPAMGFGYLPDTDPVSPSLTRPPTHAYAASSVASETYPDEQWSQGSPVSTGPGSPASVSTITRSAGSLGSPTADDWN